MHLIGNYLSTLVTNDHLRSRHDWFCVLQYFWYELSRRMVLNQQCVREFPYLPRFLLEISAATASDYFIKTEFQSDQLSITLEHPNSPALYQFTEQFCLQEPSVTTVHDVLLQILKRIPHTSDSKETYKTMLTEKEF